MGIFKYTKKEQVLNNVLKYNQDISVEILNDTSRSAARATANDNIALSEELLKSSGYEAVVSTARKTAETNAANRRLEHRPALKDWNVIVSEASKYAPAKVGLEDLLPPAEIRRLYKNWVSGSDYCCIE